MAELSDFEKENGAVPLTDFEKENGAVPLSAQAKDNARPGGINDKLSQLKSMLAGSEQGLTLNHAPQISGAIGAGLEKGAGMMGFGPQAANAKAGLPQQSLAELYNEYKAQGQKRDAAAQAAHPGFYGAGAIGGGLLGAAGGGMALKAAMPTLSAAAPYATATGQMANRIAPGALPLMGAGAAIASGSSQAPLGSQQNLEDISEGAAGGLIGSQLGSPALQKTAAAAQKTAAGTKKLAGLTAETLTGGEGANAFNAGMGPIGGKGELLVGNEAQGRVAKEANDFAAGVPTQITNELNQLGEQKNAIVRIAQEHGITIDPADIDNFVSTHVENGPTGERPDVMREMQQIKDLIQNAKSGPEVKQITRRYFGNGNTEKGEFANLFAQKQGEEQALQAQESPPPTSQKEQFEQLFQQKKAEQQAVPGGIDETPMELSYEPIEGQPDKVLGLIRQPQTDAQGNFSGYKKIASQVIEPDAAPIVPPRLEMILQPTDVPGKSLGIIRKPILDDDGTILGYKKVSSKLLDEDEAAQFKDQAEIVRAGGRDLSKPEEMLDLYKNLVAARQKLSTPEAQKETDMAVRNIQSMLRDNINGLDETDAQIAPLKKAQKILGNMADKDPMTSTKLISGLVNRSKDTSLGGDLAQRQLNNAFDQIKLSNPELGHQIEAQAQNIADKLRLTAAASEKAYLPRPLSTPQAFIAKGANVLGYGIGNVTPDWIRQTASAVLSKGGQAAQGLSNVLTKVADKDQQSRTAVLFGLMQQPGYRDMLKEYLPQATPPDGQAKTNELQKYK